MAEAGIRAPETRLDPTGGHRPSVEHEFVGGLVREWVVDADQALGRALAAESEVSARVDDERRVAAETIGGQVCGQALAAAAGVDPDAARTGDDPGNGVNSDHLPAGIGVRGCGPAIWSDCESLLDGGRGMVRARRCVARF